MSNCLDKRSLNIFDRLRFADENLRWFDQKLLPDILMVVCYGINWLPPEKQASFTNKDLRGSEEYQTKIMNLFNKSSPERAYEEYTKIARQALNCLAYAGILDFKRSANGNVYSLVERELVRDMAQDQHKAFVFLALYIERFLIDNRLDDIFENYLDAVSASCTRAQRSEALNVLRDGYLRFHGKVVKSKSDDSKEAPRIFNKVLNTVAAASKTYGTTKGHISDHPLHVSNLNYTEENFRDRGQDRSLTRGERLRLIPFVQVLTTSSAHA